MHSGSRSVVGRVAIVFGLALVVAGCGSDSPFDYVPASGTITYEDGTPIPADGVKLIFDSQAPPVGNAHPRPGTVVANAQGEFQDVTSYKFADGLVPGKHKVSILFANDKEGNLLVPPEYTKASTTPLEVDTADLPFKILVPRPQ